MQPAVYHAIRIESGPSAHGFYDASFCPAIVRLGHVLSTEAQGLRVVAMNAGDGELHGICIGSVMGYLIGGRPVVVVE